MLIAVHAGPASAEMCILSSIGSSCGSTFGPAYGGQRAIFRQIGAQAVPSVWRKTRFCESSEPGGNRKGLQHGRGDPVPDGRHGNATHALRLNDINNVVINGTNYRQFFLDIQETSGAEGVA